MGLSSNIIWHQTNFYGLRAIISSRKLMLSYSLETIKWKESKRNYAFPMLSFCDIPFADISEYLGKYGGYTIGFRRDWGKSKGLSPVWYRDANAISLREQMDLFREKIEGNKDLKDPYDKVLWHTIANTKNYEGELKKYKFDSYRFFDEREFRFVPTYDDLENKGIAPFLTNEEYKKYKDGNNNSSLIPEYFIDFDYKDIAYVLVSEKNKINAVKKLFKNNFDDIVFISNEQVRKDIIGLSHFKQDKKDEEDKKMKVKKKKNANKHK